MTACCLTPVDPTPVVPYPLSNLQVVGVSLVLTSRIRMPPTLVSEATPPKVDLIFLL